MNTSELHDTHLDECATLFVETFNAAPWNDHWDHAHARRRLSDIVHTPGFVGLLLCDGNTIVAAALGNIYSGPCFPDSGLSWTLS